MSAPYMRWFPGSYAKHTRHLTRCEHGTYRLLIDAMWAAGGRLPADDRRLARLAMCTAEEWADCRETILEFFYKRGGHIRHRRIDAELAHSLSKKLRAERGGNASALKRANENRMIAFSQVASKRNLDPTTSESLTSIEERKNPLKPPKGGDGELFGTTDQPIQKKSSARVRRPSTLNGHAEDFQRWYDAYPKHVERGLAEREFPKALALAGIDALMAGAARYAAEMRGHEPRFIISPGRWLARQRWADEYDERSPHGEVF